MAIDLKRGDNMKASFKHSEIVAIASIVGENVIKIDDEKIYYKNEKQIERLKKSIGFDSRHVVSENVTTYDLCKKAAINVMSKLKLEPKDFDAIISVTQTPDYYMPGNAHLLHGDLGFRKECIAIDLELGCSGFIYGLFQAYMLCENFAQRVLLLNGDTLSKIVNVKNRIDAPVFGDAGTATVIQHTSEENLSYFILNSDGNGSQLMIRKASAFRFPSNEKTRAIQVDENGNEYTDEDFYMSGGDVFTFTLNTQPQLLENILMYSNSTKNEIDYFVFHQANKFIVDNIALKCNLDINKVPIKHFSQYGNQSGASIPATICSELTYVSNKSIVLQGFGIGLSYGACKIDTRNLIVLPIEIY